MLEWHCSFAKGQQCYFALKKFPPGPAGGIHILYPKNQAEPKQNQFLTIKRRKVMKRIINAIVLISLLIAFNSYAGQEDVQSVLDNNTAVQKIADPLKYFNYY